MHLLLLSAYDAQSHRQWRESLVQAFPEFEWTVLVMPARYFAWRIRGNALHFAREIDQADADYDAVIATSMVDLATLRGLCPAISSLPTLVYFHENQFSYPTTNNARSSIEPAMVNLMSALAATRVCFNSHYNMASFFAGLKALISAVPDYAPKSIVALIEKKSDVLAVPFAQDVENYREQKPDRVRVDGGHTLVWNHRWEYDKGPERLFNFIRNIPPSLRLTCHIIGQRFKQVPSVFCDIESLLQSRNWLGRWGYVEDRQDYLGILTSSDFVLSTALHDFQGLAVLEAARLGCTPIVPDRLAYREYCPAQMRYVSTASSMDAGTDEIEAEARAAVALLLALVDKKPETLQLDRLAWPVMKALYRHQFSLLFAGLQVDRQ